MKRYYLVTILVSILMLIGFGYVVLDWGGRPGDDLLKIGFIYENDDATPYSYNFSLAQTALEKKFQAKIRTYTKSNVLEDEMEEPVRELIRYGCRLIFCCTNSSQVQSLAAEFPDVQFCQVSTFEFREGVNPPNFHTFNSRTFEGRYVSGIAAGMKLRELLDSGAITPEQALVGYVAAFPTSEVISGFTAFILGVRSAAPEAKMIVRYTSAWNSYNLEKACAKTLIEDGCIIISQHTGTVGPAVACEEASAKSTVKHPVFHIGFNQSMIDVAPTTSLVSARTDWAPYVLQAAEAVMNRRPIERVVKATAHGTDMSAGFDRGWIEMLEVNQQIVAPGTEAEIDKAVEALEKGNLSVFQGNYLGVDPENSEDTYDLNRGYIENRDSSAPTFHYILQDVVQVIIEEEEEEF